MGKKKGKDKKGKGAEKTALKTERKAEKKTKKMLKEKGEEDIETLIAQFQEEDKQKQAKLQYSESKCDPPSPRCNMSFTAHPERDELLMFGGEYFNGSKTFMYNDLFSFHTKSGEWHKLNAPIAPPPRCGHQAVAVHHGGGQLWIFGGEFASPTQSQFYHYKDLWFFSLRDKCWKKISSSGGPSSRSGHRMAVFKKLILLFGGFHDNTRDYRYFNDVHAFNVETLMWMKLDICGAPPSPRSGCMLACDGSTGQLLIYGGYSKEHVKRDVDRGKTHTDMFMLAPAGKSKQAGRDSDISSWKWTVVKQSGNKPPPRCGATMIVTPGNRAVMFGGVLDEEENEEDLKGSFFNDMYSLEVEHGRWHQVSLRGNSKTTERRKRRRKKSRSTEDGTQVTEISDSESDSLEDDMEEEVKRLKVNEEDDPQTPKDDGIFQVKLGNQAAADDGIFTVTVNAEGGASCDNMQMDVDGESGENEKLFTPCGRMNTCLTVKNGVLYLYGGMLEEGDKQITLSDFYSLDLHKLAEWKTIIENDASKQEWIESEPSSGDDDSDDETVEGATKGDDGDDSSDESDDDMDFEEEPPEVTPGVAFSDFFQQHEAYWLNEAKVLAAKEGISASEKKALKAARKMAEEYHAKYS